MQITRNTSSMRAALTVAVDKDGREHCVAVVKGTFAIEKDGTARLADEQDDFVFTDQHYGEPGLSSVRYECEFAAFKPRADLIVNGQAYAPSGRPVTEMLVGVAVGESRKSVKVVGDRRWKAGIGRPRPSDPEPFVTMPLVYERTFGGSDHTHADVKHQGTEMRNPLGVGFRKNPDSSSLVDKPLPNLEDPNGPSLPDVDNPSPVGFGVVGRGWHPRIGHAGTYDERWKNERAPFLPEDFDNCYFLAAPIDQQYPWFKGGEAVRCINMTANGTVSFTLPRIDLPITARFRQGDTRLTPNLDTVIVEPDRYRFITIWRVCIPLGRNVRALSEVLVGDAA